MTLKGHLKSQRVCKFLFCTVTAGLCARCNIFTYLLTYLLTY